MKDLPAFMSLAPNQRRNLCQKVMDSTIRRARGRLGRMPGRDVYPPDLRIISRGAPGFQRVGVFRRSGDGACIGKGLALPRAMRRWPVGS
jgi:hypothetical protein